MIGGIAGDIMGSVFEYIKVKRKDVKIIDQSSRFTDDTVLSIAVADAILSKRTYRDVIIEYGLKYPNAGYGAGFKKWLHSSERVPYNSYGNGSAMRVGPVGLLFSSQDEVLVEARKTAEITHNHPSGIRGAQATALAVHLAHTGKSKKEIRDTIQKMFGYDLKRTLQQIRKDYSFQVSCDNTVPEALTAFLESESVEDAIRNSISLGGDSDTIATIAGIIAEAYFKHITQETIALVVKKLDEPLMEKVIDVYNVLPYDNTREDIINLVSLHSQLLKKESDSAYQLSRFSNTVLVNFSKCNSRTDPLRDVTQLDLFNFENYVYDLTDFHEGFSAPQVGILLIPLHKKRRVFMTNIPHWVREFLRGRDIYRSIDIFDSVDEIYKYLNERNKTDLEMLLMRG